MSTFARNFNGTDQYGQSHLALNYSSYPQIALSFWLRMASYANTDRFVVNHASNYTGVQGAFYVEADNGVAGDGFLFGLTSGSPGGTAKRFVRPSAAAWHHWAVHWWPAGNAGVAWVNLYFDGVLQSFTSSTDNVGGNCANDFLGIMARGGGSIFCPGDFCQLAIWGDTSPSAPILSAGNVASLFGGNDATPLSLSLGSGTAALLDYWKLSGTGTSEPNSVGSRPAMDLFGAIAPAQTDGPVQSSGSQRALSDVGEAMGMLYS